MDMDEPMAVTASPDLTGGNKQRLFIIRHGERLDNVDYSWERTAERPYDPPLTAHGIEEAVTAARDRFRGKDIKHVISSPFLRCLQTAQQICNVLQLPGIHTCNEIVDVVNGHCGIHQQPEVPAQEVAKQGIKIAQVDDRPLPEYPERTRDGLKRFIPAYCSLADEYWPHNVVIVTHGYGVLQALAAGKLGKVHRRGAGAWVDYCGHVELSRTEKDSHEWTMEDHEEIVIYE